MPLPNRRLAGYRGNVVDFDRRVWAEKRPGNLSAGSVLEYRREPRPADWDGCKMRIPGAQAFFPLSQREREHLVTAFVQLSTDH